MHVIHMLGSIAVAVGLTVAAPVHAQDKAKERAPVTKVLLDNEKVRVAQTTFQPGDVSRAQRRARVSYTLKGGLLQRTSADGKKIVNTRKVGDAVWLEADADAVTNVGKTVVTVVTIQLK